MCSMTVDKNGKNLSYVHHLLVKKPLRSFYTKCFEPIQIVFYKTTRTLIVLKQTLLAYLY